MEDKITFDFYDLLPKIEPFALLSGLLSGDVTSEGISSLFIYVLWLLFGCFLLWVFWAWGRSWRSTAFFRKLLRGLKPDSLMDKRQDLKQQARQQRNKRLGELWEEFDETFVVSKGEERIQNTYDAAHFFNAHTLGRGITENRLLAAVPAFLTAIGVVGTFTGLFLGLSNVNPEDVASITRLIDGASIAFKTSVWGVALSFVFNLIEKAVEQRVRYKITTLQNKIDALFPRLSPEQTLVHVHEETRQAAIALDGLSERIGNKMQETINQVTQNVQSAVFEGIQQGMQPALESLAQAAGDLASRQARGGAEALENLVHQFSDGLRGQGEQQREMMEATTAEVKTAISQWGGSMTHFMDALEALNQRMDTRENARAASFDSHIQASQDTLTRHVEQLQQQAAQLVADYVDQAQTQTQAHLREWTKQAEQYSSTMETAVGQFGDGLRGQGEQQRKMMEATTAEVKTAISQWGGSMTHFMDALEALNQRMDARETAWAASFDSHIQASQDTLTRHVEQSQQQAAQLVADYVDQAQTQTQTHLREWTKQAEQYSSTMETAVGQFGDGLRGQGEQQRKMMEATTAEVKTAISQWGGSMTHFMDALEALNQRMDTRETARAASFDGHIQASQDTLTRHVEQSQQQAAQLVADYVDQAQTQTQTHLREWTKQAEQYSSTMETAVGQFGDGLRGQGEQQRKMMEATTAEVKTAISQWGGSMTHFMDALEALNQRMDTRETARAASFDSHIQASQDAFSRYVEQSQQQAAQLVADYVDQAQTQTQTHLREWTKQAEQYSSTMETAVGQFGDGLRGQGEQQRKMMEATTAEVKTAISQWGGSMTHFMDALEALNQRMDARETAWAASFDGHIQASQTVLEQSQRLYEQIAAVTEGLQTSASAIRTGGELLNNASGGLRTLSERLQSGVDQLGRALGQVLEQTRRLARENETTGRNINQVIGVITGLKDMLSSAADRIAEAADASRRQTTQLTQHQQQLFAALEEHVDQLQKQVAQLLRDYASQVQTQTQDRLNEWTKQTQNYTNAMQAAVVSLASTVEEMDGKIERRR